MRTPCLPVPQAAPKRQTDGDGGSRGGVNLLRVPCSARPLSFPEAFQGPHSGLSHPWILILKQRLEHADYRGVAILAQPVNGSPAQVRITVTESRENGFARLIGRMSGSPPLSMRVIVLLFGCREVALISRGSHLLRPLFRKQISQGGVSGARQCPKEAALSVRPLCSVVVCV